MNLRNRTTIFALAWVLAWPEASAQLAFRPGSAPRRPGEKAAPEIPVAADGYCVVTLRDQRQWELGNRSIGAQFDGRQYWFAGERELAIFAAAPVVYAPVLSGDCVVTFAESGKRFAGRAQFGVVQGGRIYFFANDEQRAKFMAAPQTYESADIADEGRCIVTRVEKQRDVAGLPEAMLLAGGLRRMFAGAYERSLYLQNPDYYNTASAAPTAPLATDPALTLAAPLASQQQWRGAGSQAASMPSTAQGVSPPGPRAGLASPSARLTPAPTPKPADSTAKKDKSNEPRKDDDAEDILLTSEPAMGGYCPVTLKQKGLWVRGRYDDFAQVDNLVFLTAGPEQREAFDADPAQFVPALGGNCVVSLVDRGEKARGSVFHASQYQGRFYLFADAESKATFNAGPARYATIDMAEGGACVVTLAETGESRPGFAEFAVWYNGLLYRFASAEQKAKFAATPDKYAK